MKNIRFLILILVSIQLNAQQNTDYEITNNYGTTGRARLLMNITDRTWQLENDGYMNIFKIRDANVGSDDFENVDIFWVSAKIIEKLRQ